MALDVDAVAIRQRRWWRHSVHGADPPARRLPPSDNRWQHGAIVEALYLAGDEATVWAEWDRHLAEAGIPPNQQMPRDLWTWAVDPGLEVADLRSTERLKRVGLAVPRPGRKTWPPHQEVGETLWREGWPGLLAPSAARPQDGLILCLFRETEGVPRARPLPPPRMVREPPVPPPGMTTRPPSSRLRGPTQRPWLAAFTIPVLRGLVDDDAQAGVAARCSVELGAPSAQ